MRVTFGIDVSKATSEIAIVVNGQAVSHFKITNNQPGFNKLQKSLNDFQNPEIVFEATGLYSRRLRVFLDDYGYRYTQLNPLASKKQLDRLRPNKTDKNDALHLAETQFEIRRALTYQQDPIYQQLLDWSRFYDEITCDSVANKNRLHKALQCTFPEAGGVLNSPTGHLYWHLLQAFPIASMVRQSSSMELSQHIRKFCQLSVPNSQALAARLRQLASESYPCVGEDSGVVMQVRYLATELLRLDDLKNDIIQKMARLAQDLPELAILESIPGISVNTAVRLIGELGDIRRFTSANKLNAFVGIDLRHFESGEYIAVDHISKRGNPYARKILYRTILNMMVSARTKPSHINDYCRERKKQSSGKADFKKIAMGAISRLNRTIYHLILNNQKYDYLKTRPKAES
ncbi:IS110 family RNA-guided transposase [Lentilactobacillus buchneri]|uniref:Transposase IS116 family protein n=1 Tax=Lentilactobacillus buchneri subsp. silagei CD034 TaxID=1071400 RepID=J9W3J1_LENBU|nr:IS110 family transposase [Lentilactobacillus buchneri]AFS01038.1 transposase IS116 family protein [Lentilactobacillus buchneri subsp. silagei CD034]